MAQILIVGDTEECTRPIEESVRARGYDPLVVRDGAEALRHLRTQRADGVLAALPMSGFDGLQLCRACKTDPALQGIPFLLIVPEDFHPEDEAFAVRMGAQGVIRTPEDEQAVGRALQQAIGQMAPPADMEESVYQQGYRAYLKRTLDATLQALREKEARLARLSHIDELTELYTRDYLFRNLEVEMKRAIRENTPVGCIVMDMDGFHTVNETYGRSVGDRVLKAMAAQIKRSSRATDVLVRYGGDEFLALLPNTDTVGSLVFAQKMRVLVAELSVEGIPHEPNGSVTVSIGVSDMRWQEIGSRGIEALHDLIHWAEEALQRARADGGDRIVGRTSRLVWDLLGFQAEGEWLLPLQGGESPPHPGRP